MAEKNRSAEALKKFADQLAAAAKHIDKNVNSAAGVLEAARGPVVVLADGGMIPAAKKIASGLRSAGKAAFWMSSESALGGELACAGKKSAAIILSAGGERENIVEALPLLKKAGFSIVALSPSARGTVSKAADLVICIPGPGEGADAALASTCCASAVFIGGLICETLLEKCENPVLTARSRDEDDRRTVGDIISSRKKTPSVPGETSFRDALVELTSKGLGAISVTDDKGHLTGIITDGDVRRLLQKSQGSLTRIFLTNVETVMTKNPRRISPSAPLAEAVEIMENYAITVLPVVDKGDVPVGMIHLHDLVRDGAAHAAVKQGAGRKKPAKK